MSTICIAEDREACEPAIKLLIMSLCKYNTEYPINVFYPPAKESFAGWLKNYPNATLHIEPLFAGRSWNLKPQVLLYLIDRGYNEVIWIDSDIIISRNIFSLFCALDDGTVVVTEEALFGNRDDRDALRARLWGFSVGRVFPFTLNSAVLRVTSCHRPLLTRWRELLESEGYRDWQSSDYRSRPQHMVGDQDVLTALLTSEEFAKIPIKILRRGNEIIQFFGLYGYTIRERIMGCLGGGASFVHAQGSKPWLIRWHANTLREYFDRAYQDLSPYTMVAQEFSAQLGDAESWMRPHSNLSAILRVAALGYLPFSGLPIALAIDVVRLFKYFARHVSKD